ncbi:cupin domain-containing protein [Algivirga pacifica]|uniref:Cupin type-2 domain-containing protein n=1 Tax=Algivirga pacifica TaxID=1162670 RepID=A0ABP9D7W7_9BACT
MNKRITSSNKKVIIQKFGAGKKYWMNDKEYTGIVVSKEATNSEYIISDGVIAPEGFVPEHYHKWEDQTFHIIKGYLEVKIGDEMAKVEAGDTIHCPRGTSHYIKNIGDTEAQIISYIFPGDWAEDFMAETSKQVESGNFDLELIEEKYGVVYLK